MNKQQAQNIIKETFENPFEKGRFTGFIKNLLNQIEGAPFTYQGKYIPDAFKTYISSLERIGKYSDGENKIDILIVKLKKETSLERARTMQRNFIAWYLNGSRGGELKDAALVAFVAPNEDDWRFSLVKMDYRFEPEKDGRVKVKEEFTPARRWSFLVGKNESSHTAQSRLVPILADDEHRPTLAQIEEAFNIEKVTREFFEKYRQLFLWTKETLDDVVNRDSKIQVDFETKNVDTVDFAKKLLGQIVFLYFLQKKGWFGVERDEKWGTGSKRFLRELFESKRGKYSNFFNDILEPLFYEALRIDRRHDDDYYKYFNCKIPFLNGGLFDPINNYDWVHTDILLPNELFSNNNKTKQGDIGNGILDIFDRYNFTVKEDEPLEKEVAVDPEMLGKVFENLLAVKDRKSKGTYYTPREIVHYMCQQSLINYLYSVIQASSLKEEQLTALNQAPNQKDNLIKKIRQDVCDTIMYFDPNAPIEIKQRNLPHWQQKGTSYFVTFRLFDSIPKHVAEKIKEERIQWLKTNKISHPSELKKLNLQKRIEYYRLFSKRYDELLDNGHGSCVLAKPNCKKLMDNALKHFDGDRYDLDKFVIMPNHVHVIVIPKQNWSLSKITHSWKSFTSNEINKIIGRDGQLWMSESFDHIIRSSAQLEKIRKYIEDNPKMSNVANDTQDSRFSKRDESMGEINHRHYKRHKHHSQDACDTISKEEIETLIKFGEQVGENEATVEARGKETDTYFYKLPESIRQNAKLIDEKLATIKVCDPAIGSGAFPVGMMHEIVKTRNVLTTFLNLPVSPLDKGGMKGGLRTIYQFKRECIEKSLYGVDIDPGAVEIAKLRLWLSLVVDEDDIKRIKPLPNLDYKIVCGNSLLSVEKDLFNNQLFAELEGLKPLYFNETNPTKKQEYKQQIDNLISQITDGHNEFDFEVYFSEVFHEKKGFDVVIGNPPYVEFKKLPKTQKEKFSSYQSNTGKYDIFVVFMERSIQLCKMNGNICFIEPSTFLKKDFGSGIRKYIRDNCRIITICDFADIQVFKSTTNYTGIFIFRKESCKDYVFDYHQYKNNGRKIDVNNFNASLGVKSDYWFKKFILVNSKKLYENEWNFQEIHIERFLEKINQQSIPLAKFCSDIFQGIASGKDEVFYINDDIINSWKIEKKIIYKLLRGKDIQKYKINWSGDYVIYPYDKNSNVFPEKLLNDQFPNCYSYLKSKRHLLLGRDYFNKSNKLWFELWNQRNIKKFAKKRIVTPEISSKNSFTIIEDFFGNTKTYHIILRRDGDTLIDEYYLLALLNSKLLDFIYKKIATPYAGGFYAYKTQFLSKISIKEISESQQKPFINIVDRILAITKDEDYLQNSQKQAKVKSLEREIDRMVYQLYGLTEEEIKIVEGKND